LGTNAGTYANAALQINGGGVQTNYGNMFLPSSVNVTLLGDWLGTSSNDLAIAGNVYLSPVAGLGATRTFNISANTNTSGEVAFNGTVIGAAGSNIIKTGNQTLVFNGVNTYLGTTTINSGVLAVGTNVASECRWRPWP